MGNSNVEALGKGAYESAGGKKQNFNVESGGLAQYITLG